MLLLLPAAGLFPHNSHAMDSREIFYVGTFDSQGLFVYEFDRSSMKMTLVQTVGERQSPNFQALHPDRETLYSVSGHTFTDDTGHHTVSAYRIDGETGHLSMINEQSSEGRGVCHVSVDPQGEFVYVSNYSSGNLSVYRIQEDGGLSEAVDVVQHEGGSVNERRQQGPHVHSIIPSPDGRYIYVSDLGIDKIMIYEVNRQTGGLSPASVPFVENTPGAGPRHFTIHPNGTVAYSVEELSSTVAVFRVDKQTGALEQIQRIEMLPEDYEDQNTAADIHISPDGSHLYATNRGDDSLVIYRIDQLSGELELVGHESTRGGHPRNFGIDKQGEFVFVANRDDDNVVFFSRDEATGVLQYTGMEIEAPAPVCVTQLIPD